MSFATTETTEQAAERAGGPLPDPEPPMDVLVRKVGRHTGIDALPQAWPGGWAVPRIGDTVTYPDGESFTVSNVVWYPEGDDRDRPHPYVYVLLRDDV